MTEAERRPARASPDDHSAAEKPAIHLAALESMAELRAAVELLDEVWAPKGADLSAPFLRALTHGGHYVAGAFWGDELCAVSVGFFTEPLGRTMHSHITGVLPSLAGQGIGRALKMHQRDWAIERGLETITWTYDPLIARNAFFNLAVLRARPVEYLVDFYGDDPLVAIDGDGTDRVLVAWDIGNEPDSDRSGEMDRVDPAASAMRLDRSRSGAPLRPKRDQPDQESALIRIPRDFEHLRQTAPGIAQAWRSEFRAVMSPLLNSGEWNVEQFLREGAYVLRRRGAV